MKQADTNINKQEQLNIPKLTSTYENIIFGVL